MIITRQILLCLAKPKDKSFFPKHFSRLSNPLQEMSMKMPVLKFHIHEVQGNFLLLLLHFPHVASGHKVAGFPFFKVYQSFKNS